MTVLLQLKSFHIGDGEEVLKSFNKTDEVSVIYRSSHIVVPNSDYTERSMSLDVYVVRCLPSHPVCTNIV